MYVTLHAIEKLQSHYWFTTIVAWALYSQQLKGYVAHMCQWAGLLMFLWIITFYWNLSVVFMFYNEYHRR